jgi:hypothetical protein
MLQSMYYNNLKLVPGLAYDFRITTRPTEPNNTIYRGVFVKYEADDMDRQWAIFDMIFWSHTFPPLKTMKFYTGYMLIRSCMSPIVAKQLARGLSNRIPEDCAGIIERMLVGNETVGRGPDRYAER